MNQFDTFSALHFSDSAFLLGNAWDAGSAKLLAENGLKAIATSSAAVANVWGYEDGENLPFELLLQTATYIKKAISLPLSVDMERGYSDSIDGVLQNIHKLYDIGVAGINLEDSGNDRKLEPAASYVKKISAITDYLAKNNIKMFINARTDAFLLKQPGALAETLERVKLYEQAGVNGIFIPFVVKETDIAEVVKATKLPVNVVIFPQLPAVERLNAIGVKRISLGSSLYNAIKSDTIARIKDLVNTY